MYRTSELPASGIAGRHDGPLPWPSMPVPPAPAARPSRHAWPPPAAFTDTGGLASSDELAEMLRREGPRAGYSQVSQVARWIVSREVLAFGDGYGWTLPLFQFDLRAGAPRPAMPPLLAELRALFDDVDLSLWFVTPNRWLAGARPALAMLDDPQCVLLAARAERFAAHGA